MRKKMKKYSDYFKWEVIREVIRGIITKEEARRRYGIAGKSTVLKWMRHVTGQNGNGEIPSKEHQVILQLREELEQKNQQLDYLKLKSEALDKMITIAENNYGIHIRKKCGAKRSKK